MLKNTNFNIFDKYMKEIFHKMYLANVSNRLRELENPRNIDCKRWVWELVQNAKDSIAGNKERKNIDIKIIVEGDSYKFLHNGSPFTMGTLTALLYKFSEGKRNDCESTGRFGTGFLTTHSLSKIVKITSDFIDNEDSKIYGFSVTMFREGEDKELLEGLKNTENSFERFQETFGWTTYEYIVKTDANKEAGKLGIQNFKENIALVMLFCPEINSIELNDNGKIFSIEHINNIHEPKNESEQFHKFFFKVNNNGQISKRIFLSYKINEYNEQLTKKFEKERNLRICCALELDDNNNILHKDSIPCLFCSLPLVGSENHKFPFFVNSPDFEPDSERTSLLLDGKEINEKTGKISEPGINKMILLRITDIYKDFLEYISKTNIRKRYFLINGINSIPQINFFDSKWYERNFISSMRDILLEYPIAWNEQEHKKLTDIFIPNINCYNEEMKKKKVYNYISELNNKRVPCFEESQIFEKIIWKNDSRIKFKDLENCIKIIAECRNISNLNKIINSDVWKWIDDFLQFVQNFHYEYFINLNCAIIPNMNSEFVLLNSNLAFSKDVPENMIECMEMFNINWRKEHLNENLLNFRTGIEHDIKNAVSKILECVNKWSDKVLILMQYIPYDNKSEFQQKREMIYELCSIMFKDKISQKKDGTKFPEEIWDKIDNMVFKRIIQKIEKYEYICDECSIEFINKFLNVVTKYYPLFINYSIIPNKNGKFCQINNLFKEDNIPDIFKECLKNCFNQDINEELVDDRIYYVNSLKKKNIYDYINTLHSYFRRNENYNKKNYGYLSLSDNKEAAKYLIRIIPKESDNPNCEKQRNLFLIYEFFTKNKYNYSEININESDDNNLWLYSNKYIYEIIIEIIEKHDNIKSLAKSLGKNTKSTIKKLKDFITFSSKGKIVLNQNNNLCKIDELSNEKDWGDASEKLKKIASYLDYDVKEKLVHESMGNPCKRDMNYKDICEKIDEIMSKKFNEISNHQDEKYKSAARCLSEYFDEIGEKQAEQYFRFTFPIKEKIAYNVIYDEKTRKNFSELDKAFGINNLSELTKKPKTQKIIKKLINNDELAESVIELEKKFDIKTISRILIHSKLIESIINNDKKISQYLEFDKKFGKDATSKLIENSTQEKFVEDLIKNEEHSYNTPSKVISENKSINISFNSEITKDKVLLNFFQNSLPSFLQYAGDFDFGNENPIKIRIGITGEAYIYELLSSSGKYKSVKWNMLDNSGLGEDFEYNGKHYKIHCDKSQYDILVETFDGRKIYIEVKSTKNKFNNKVPFYLSLNQIAKMEKIEFPNEYVLAIVFNVMSQPKHFFMTLRKEI